MMVNRASDIKTNLASESFCRRFAPRFDERWKLGERLSMVRKNTGWKPMLCYIFSGLSRDLSEPPWDLSPCTRSDDATAQCSIGFQPVF
jgi:hypothetical protein